VHLELFRYYTKLAGKRAKLMQLTQKFRPRCLPYWTINSCFGAFLFVRVHFGPFLYCTKLGAKRAKLVQLMQKLMPRCRSRIFCNERSRSTPLDPKLMFDAFVSVWVHFEPFRHCKKFSAKGAKLVQLMQKFVPR
jgi:hypothetical protein